MSLGLKYDKTWLDYLSWVNDMKDDEFNFLDEVHFAEAWKMLDNSVRLSLQPFVLCKIVHAIGSAYWLGQKVERYSKFQMEEK